MALDRLVDATAQADSAAAIVASDDFGEFELELRQLQSSINVIAGRREEARRILTAALAGADSFPLDARVEILSSLAALEAPSAALARLRAEARHYATSLSLADRAALDVLEGQTLVQLGRPAEALPLLSRALASPGSATHRMSPALLWTARAWRALERPDSALAAFARLEEHWETQRRQTDDPEWQQSIIADAALYYGDLAELHLRWPTHTPEPERIRRAYDVLQRYKVRAIARRTHGPARLWCDTAEPGLAQCASLVELQTKALGKGEVFFDVFAGETATFAASVSLVTSAASACFPGGRISMPDRALPKPRSNSCRAAARR